MPLVNLRSNFIKKNRMSDDVIVTSFKFSTNNCPNLKFYYTSTKSRRGLYFHFCLSVCPMFSCEQNSSRTDEPIWMRFSLNGCFLHWLNSIEIGDLGSKVKVTLTENVSNNDEKNTLKIQV